MSQRRGNLVHFVYQRIEIATPAYGGFAMTVSGVFQQARGLGSPGNGRSQDDSNTSSERSESLNDRHQIDRYWLHTAG